ncbi:MAG: hypothetical protein ACK5ZX_03090 [Bacteroidota bacterium]
MTDLIRCETLAGVPVEDLVDFIPREHDENIFLEQMNIWKLENIEIGYLLFPFHKVEQLLQHGMSCPFEENWKGVSIGLDGTEVNFPYGNGIYCYKNLPNNFDKQTHFVIVGAILPGIDCRRITEIEASEFEFNCLPCDSLLVSNDVWVLRSASQILPLFTF